ncbi:uncharacterized protein LOC128218809 isoform X2 [Mya arenaria]|uniref:uncharacterized protein LOC128218809 isoform X2 n=1 Tax=Mya arenaria TaxID=6604 RepID=UPI0022E9819F|nr:uncharacterized protein LOC128218809 isoform X2 [Mya arenaria]
MRCSFMCTVREKREITRYVILTVDSLDPTMFTRPLLLLCTCVTVGVVTAQGPPLDTQASATEYKPRRGRIVARVHGSKLNIPSLHKKAAERFASQTRVNSECGELCPPQWLTYIDGMRGLIANVSEPACEFAEQFSACSVPHEICQTTPVRFRCCPSHCVTSAATCYRGPPTDFICVPKTIQPWMEKMFKLLVLGQAVRT